MCPTIPLGFDEINDFLFIYLFRIFEVVTAGNVAWLERCGCFVEPLIRIAVDLEGG
jgi:hypothetical protein